jgi:mersacidin/lichenicidin family type 2 lantibiotic
MKSDHTDTRPQATSQSHIAALYQRSVLDPIVEVARTISHDFVRRPRDYRAVPENIAGILKGFRILTGSNAEWLSATQRANIFAPLFGAAFCSNSIGLRSAAVAFAEQGAEGNPALLESVRDAVVAFRGYLKSVEGRVTSEAERETAPVFRNAIEVLRNEAVAGVFDLPAAPGGNWPLDEASKADAGAYLIEEIQRALDLSSIRPAMTRDRFTLLQRVAHNAALTITGVLDDADGWDTADRIDALVQNACGWEKALQELLSGIDVVRAWKDPYYRQNLNQSEKDMMAPHPSGEVDLKDTQLNPAVARARSGAQASTITSFPAVCCCTGDLSCAPPPPGSVTDYRCCTRTCGIECG